MKFVSWNVNGLRAVAGKGFAGIFTAFDADFFCLQEIKMQAGQLDLQFEGYQSYWNYADRKGYSGTAIYSRHQPLAVTCGIGEDRHDHEGRVITLEFDRFYLVTVYTPNSQDGLARLDYRMDWEKSFQNYLHSLDSRKPVVVCGDMNVAHREIDLKNPERNHQSAGFSDQERECIDRLLHAGFTDTFRCLHPDLRDAYSWWSYRMRARDRNIGWRIDYFLISDRLVPQLQAADIHNDIFGSDHCPVSIVLSDSLLQRSL